MDVFESVFAIDSPHMDTVKQYGDIQKTQLPLNESIEKLKIMIDFDGVIHQWDSKEEFNPDPQNPIIEGVKEAIEFLSKKYQIVIFTTRVSMEQNNNNLDRVEKNKQFVKKYLLKHSIYFDLITGDKLAAIAYIDDRAFRFKNWFDTLTNLKSENLI